MKIIKRTRLETFTRVHSIYLALYDSGNGKEKKKFVYLEKEYFFLLLMGF